MKKREIEFKNEKLNLIPIMDAVFIFIFFLLFSVQLIKIYEIEMDAPIVNENPDYKEDKDPLNLKVSITKSSIEITKKLSNITVLTLKRGSDQVYEKLNQVLWKVKKDYPKDKDIIIKPDEKIDYETIVKVIEAVKVTPKDAPAIINLNGKEIKIDGKMFGNIALEPLR